MIMTMRAHRTSRWLGTLAVLVSVVLVSTASAASAQTNAPGGYDLGRTRLPTSSVWITADNALTQGGTRRADSLLNGALIGAGAGVASGVLLCLSMEPWRNCRDDVGPMVGFAAIGAGVGIAIDALIRDRTPITVVPPGSARLYTAPIVARKTGGLKVWVTF